MAIAEPVGATTGTAVPAPSITANGAVASGADVTMRVWRGGETGGAYHDYRVAAHEGEVVLDVVHRIQATQAQDLAVRWNCKAGKCGSCSAEVNGRPRLMCMTRMSSLPVAQPISIAPLKTFRHVRDLVTDVSPNYAKARAVPAFLPKARERDGTRRMYQEDVDRVQEMHKCIECYLCQNVCHVLRDHPENMDAFAGPRFFLRLAALEMHPADEGNRLAMIQRQAGLGLCNITKCCTEVCPEHIKITDNAVIPLKERVAGELYDPLAWALRKITGHGA
jgi:succinate dehydrogenase / fumarate reductase iron-sulfur subunit